MEEIQVNIPVGKKIDVQNSDLEKGIIRFTLKEFPKTWAEFCRSHPVTTKEYFIRPDSELEERESDQRIISDDRNLGTKETCQAVLALMQLIQLRDCYNDGWRPDWTNDEEKYCIVFEYDQISRDIFYKCQQTLAFKNAQIRNMFVENFRHLIDIAKPVL